MGNIDSRAQFEGGYLYVKTAQPFYYPGQTVYGKVYIRTMVPMKPRNLDIFVKGKEKASFKYRDTVHHRDADGNTRTEHIDRWEYLSRKLVHFKGNCFTF